MAECELCGKRAETTVEIEGAKVSVCYKCAGERPKPAEERKPFKRMPRMPEELEQAVVENFSSLVKAKRENMRLTQKEFSGKIMENENVIKRIEEGWIPPFETVKKFERFLKMKLIEKSPAVQLKRSKQERITIGDVVEIK